ncbi:MAG: phosphoribosylanthranilate isomerase [Desulfobacterales bacterium]|nr:phosphoribosylanthranilate isomerase [Desulfobacterales bacterium]
MDTTKYSYTPQIKICGLTNIDEAQACAVAGADAVGFIFFPKSPRNIDDDKARSIIRTLPEKVQKVGVFVNETFSNIMHKVDYCGLTVVQLHGQEAPDCVDELCKKNIKVVKVLFSGGKPDLSNASNYNASAYLVECAGGPLPGGNAMEWNWKTAKPFVEKYPMVLAGGLSADNITAAINDSTPDAVDISSGVEYKPGRKDLKKVTQFINTVSACKLDRKLRRIF